MFAGIAGVLFFVIASAAEPTMIKIVTRPIGPEVKADSFAAKPKTI